MKDTTGALSFSITKSVKTAKRAPAEWIAEAPTGSSGILPLTDFGSVTFTNATATILGSTHSIGGFNNIALTMWNVSHTQVKAKAGTLQSSGGQFAVAWKSAGP